MKEEFNEYGHPETTQYVTYDFSELELKDDFYGNVKLTVETGATDPASVFFAAFKEVDGGPNETIAIYLSANEIAQLFRAMVTAYDRHPRASDEIK